MGYQWFSYHHSNFNCYAVPWYFWTYGWDWFIFGLFLFFYFHWDEHNCGLSSIILPQSFSAKWRLNFYVLLFGAAAFENSALWWSSEHRKHHKHVDTDDDPYDITKVSFGHTWDAYVQT